MCLIWQCTFEIINAFRSLFTSGHKEPFTSKIAASFSFFWIFYSCTEIGKCWSWNSPFWGCQEKPSRLTFILVESKPPPPERQKTCNQSHDPQPKHCLFSFVEDGDSTLYKLKALTEKIMIERKRLINFCLSMAIP